MPRQRVATRVTHSDTPRGVFAGGFRAQPSISEHYRALPRTPAAVAGAALALLHAMQHTLDSSSCTHDRTVQTIESLVACIQRESARADAAEARATIAEQQASASARTVQALYGQMQALIQQFQGQ